MNFDYSKYTIIADIDDNILSLEDIAENEKYPDIAHMARYLLENEVEYILTSRMFKTQNNIIHVFKNNGIYEDEFWENFPVNNDENNIFDQYISVEEFIIGATALINNS